MAGKVQMIFEGDAKKVVDEMEKMRTKLRAVEGDLAKVKAQGKQMGDSSSQALGAMKQGFASMIAPIGSVAGAIGLATKMIREMNAEAERGAQAIKEAADPLSKLAQLSGSQGDLDRRIKAARDLSVQAGIPLGASAKTVFDAISAPGVTLGDVERVAPGGRLGLEYVPTAIEGAGAIREAFKGKDKTGSVMAIVNKAQMASDKSVADFAAMLSNTVQFAQPAARIGSTDEETFAALSVTAGPGGNASEAATKLAALTGMMGKAGFKGGIAGGVERLMSMSEGERKEIIGGRKEAIAAYDILRVRLGLLRERTTEIEQAEALTGTAGSPFRQAVERARRNAILGGEFRTRQADIELQMTEAGYFGVGRLGSEAARRELTTQRIREGEMPAQRYIRRAAGWGAEQLNLGEGAVRAAEEEAPRATAAAGPLGALMQYNIWALDKIRGLFGGGGGSDAFADVKDAAKDLKDAAETLKSSPPVEDKRTQIFYGAPDERSQMRSPSGRIDPSTGR